MSRASFYGYWFLLVLGLQVSADVAIRQPCSVRPLRVCARDPLHRDVIARPMEKQGTITRQHYGPWELRELPITFWHNTQGMTSSFAHSPAAPASQPTNNVVEIDEVPGTPSVRMPPLEGGLLEPHSAEMARLGGPQGISPGGSVSCCTE